MTVPDILGVLATLFDHRVFLLAAVVFVPLERIAPLHVNQRVFRDRWLDDVIYVLANGLLIRVGLAAVAIALLALSDWLVPSGLRTVVAHQPRWLQVAEAVILADFGFYLAHRTFHCVPWLWRFHQIHHSIEQLDWLASVRVHAFDQLVTKGVSLLPLLVLGFDPVAIAISSAIYFWHSLLLHANVRITFGPLGWLIASPVFHHWHHAAQPEARGKNYAGQLSFIDKLFGTMFMPDGRLPAHYGVTDPVPSGYVSQIVYPLKRVGASSEPAAHPHVQAGADSGRPAPSRLNAARGARDSSRLPQTSS